jgi:hypothetical protein
MRMDIILTTRITVMIGTATMAMITIGDIIEDKFL